MNIRERIAGLTRSEEFRAVMVEIEGDISTIEAQLAELRARLRTDALALDDAELAKLRADVRTLDDQLEDRRNALNAVRAKATEAAAAEQEAARGRRVLNARRELKQSADIWDKYQEAIGDAIGHVAALGELYGSLRMARREVNFAFPEPNVNIGTLEYHLGELRKMAPDTQKIRLRLSGRRD
jgi:chromosome segregation ATPase